MSSPATTKSTAMPALLTQPRSQDWSVVETDGCAHARIEAARSVVNDASDPLTNAGESRMPR